MEPCSRVTLTVTAIEELLNKEEFGLQVRLARSLHYALALHLMTLFVTEAIHPRSRRSARH